MQQLGPVSSAKPVARKAHRLFLALWPDDAIRAGIAAAAVQLKADHAPTGRWIGMHRYHLTLQFLGDFVELPASLGDRAGKAAAEVDSPAFTLVLDRAGSFANRAIPWWLGCASIPEGLQRLWDALGAALATQGLEVPSTTFTPHVTILRDADRMLPGSVPIAPISWPVESFALVHSDLAGSNAYRVLGQWPLAK